jgi:hypothetical protein
MRTFKVLMDMFYEDKLTRQTFNNNITEEERTIFRRKLQKSPNKYLRDRELSKNQYDLLNYMYIYPCKSIMESRFHDSFAADQCSDCRIGSKRSKFLNFCENTENDLECAVCISAIDKKETMGVLICNHQFHKECIYKWLNCKLTCPCCRYNFKKYME